MATQAALTPKQEQVLKLLRDGRTVPQVAKTMKTKTNSVYNHIRKIRAAGIDVPTNSSRENGAAPTVAATVNESGPIEAAREALRREIEQAAADAEELVFRAQKLDKEIAEIQSERDDIDELATNAQGDLEKLRAAATALN